MSDELETVIYRDGKPLSFEELGRECVEHHLWISAFSLIGTPSDDILKGIGRAIVEQLRESDLKCWPGKHGMVLAINVTAT